MPPKRTKKKVALTPNQDIEDIINKIPETYIPHMRYGYKYSAEEVARMKPFPESITLEHYQSLFGTQLQNVSMHTLSELFRKNKNRPFCMFVLDTTQLTMLFNSESPQERSQKISKYRFLKLNKKEKEVAIQFTCKDKDSDGASSDSYLTYEQPTDKTFSTDGWKVYAFMAK
jgi:hypothetical protein